ncbi:MAG: hypothetical protein LBV16_05995 [Elusimicrobiota bacterium]|jgi:hypothetical protein|nr:hypothetical protein [Elusimicrobiota bacterium]
MKNNNDITYSEAIEKIMLANGYFAPLKLIYKEIGKYKDMAMIKGATPNNTVQERVQRDERFIKIGFGVYALKEYIEKLPIQVLPKTKEEKVNRRHSEIQGMLLEIGNQQSDINNTYTSDKKRIFDNKTLGKLATLDSVPQFTYDKIIEETVSYIDVIWFNERDFPQVVFEVEHSTNFKGAFLRFMELQDFQTKFYCVSEEKRQDKFEREKKKSAFSPISQRIHFLSYEDIENDYKKAKMNSFIKY